MWLRKFWAKVFYAPRYWPETNGVAPIFVPGKTFDVLGRIATTTDLKGILDGGIIDVFGAIEVFDVMGRISTLTDLKGVIDAEPTDLMDDL